MNVELILNLIQPYKKNDCITYGEFETVFHGLSLNEKYKVLDILAENDVEVVPGEGDDEPFFAELSTENEDLIAFEDYYDDEGQEESAEDSADSSEVILVNDDEEMPHMGPVHLSNNILIKLIQDGEKKFLQQFCIKNAGLVNKYANKYSNYLGHDLSIDDLIQAGFIGLIKAVYRFDLSKGFAFSTYAIWWIKQSISREIMDTGFSVRVPVHMVEQIIKIDSYKLMMEMEGWDEDTFYNEILVSKGMSKTAVDTALLVQKQFLKDKQSLNKLIGEDDDTELGELIPAEERSVEQIVADKDESNMLREILDMVLKEREKDVIIRRYGLFGARRMTLEEIGSIQGVTRERIRQIQQKAERKLRQKLKKMKYKEVYLWE